MSLGCEARMTTNGVSVSASGLDWSPCGQRERPLRECDTNKTALGPGDNVCGAGAEALGRAGISELRTPVAAPQPRLWGPPRGNHQPGGREASARLLGHNTREPLQVAESPLGQRRPEGLWQSHTTMGVSGKGSHWALPQGWGWEPTGCPENRHIFLGCEPKWYQRNVRQALVPERLCTVLKEIWVCVLSQANRDLQYMLADLIRKIEFHCLLIWISWIISKVKCGFKLLLATWVVYFTYRPIVTFAY